MNLFDLFESNRKDVEEARFSHPLVKSKVKFETDNPTPAAMLEYFKTSLVQNGLHWRNKMEQTGLTGMNPIEFVARQKAWSHGYGNMSDKYWNRIKPLLSVENNDVDEGYKVVPSINRERYTDLSHEGLEGPFRLKSGKVVYYDPKVGQYYDRDSDFYMSHDDYAAHELDEKSNKLGFKLTPTLVNRRQAHALTTGFKKSKFNFEEYEAESLDDELANFRSNKSGAGRAQNPFASAKPERTREIPRKPQISSAEEQQRTSQLNRCKQLLDVVNATKRTDATLSRIGNYIDKIDVNHFNPGELDNIEKYLSNYVAGAVAKKSRKASKHGKVTMINPDDVMAEGIGPDMNDPYQQGWYAGFKQVPNPYQRGTPEYDRWEDGYADRMDQPNYYDEDVTERAEPVKFSAKYPGKSKGKDYYDYHGDNFEPGDPDDLEIDRYSDEPVHNFLARTQRSTRAPRFDQDYNTMHEGKTGPGLWANIHAKQNRIKHGSGERMRKPGSKGAPTAANLKAAKTESMTEGGRLDMSSPEEKAARKAYIKANGHPPPLTPTSVVAKYNPENDKKMRDYYLRRKGIPQDKLDKMKEDGVSEATGDPKFDKMLKGITGKKVVAKQQKADTKQQSRDAFNNMFGGGNPADALSIRKKGVSEGAKVDRMVQHIKSSEKKAGKSSKDAENIAWATANKRGMLDNKNKKKNVKEDDMASAAHHSSGAKFGGYYKGTQKGAPRPGQSFGSMEESISLNTTVKAIANDIGEPITSLYATLKKMAKSYYDNNGDLKRFGLVAAGVGSRWFQTYYVNKMQTDLYDLTRQSPAHAAELKQFLRGKMVKDNLVMPKSFSEINKDLPEILARMGTKMGAEALAKNAKAWVYNKHDYEDFINKLLNGKGDDDDEGDGYGTPATVDTPSKDALLGKQRNHAEEIVNDVLRKLPSSVAGDIRNAIARAPNKLQALQQELQKRKIAPPMEEGWKSKLAGAALAGAAAFGGGGAHANDQIAKDTQAITQAIQSGQMKPKEYAPGEISLSQIYNHPKWRETVQAMLKKYPKNHEEDQRAANAAKEVIKQMIQQGNVREGIAGNMKVRSDPLTNLKQHKDIKMKTPDPFKGMTNHNNLASAKARNLVAKGAQTAGPGTGSHKNKALDVKKGLTRNLKHKGKFDFSESSNFLTWAVSSGYNVITNPAVYENAKRVYNRLLTESKGDLKPGQYYIWTVHFDDGDTSRIKIKDEKFDVKAYYKQQNKSVVNVDYNWEPHNG